MAVFDKPDNNIGMAFANGPEFDTPRYSPLGSELKVPISVYNTTGDNKMIRYSILLLATVAVVALSITELTPAQAVAGNPNNVTVIYQTMFARGSHPVLFELCGKEDCFRHD